MIHTFEPYRLGIEPRLTVAVTDARLASNNRCVFNCSYTTKTGMFIRKANTNPNPKRAAHRVSSGQLRQSSPRCRWTIHPRSSDRPGNHDTLPEAAQLVHTAGKARSWSRPTPMAPAAEAVPATTLYPISHNQPRGTSKERAQHPKASYI
jgi:hypothetical protein